MSFPLPLRFFELPIGWGGGGKLNFHLSEKLGNYCKIYAKYFNCIPNAESSFVAALLESWAWIMDHLIVKELDKIENKNNTQHSRPSYTSCSLFHLQL